MAAEAAKIVIDRGNSKRRGLLLLVVDGETVLVMKLLSTSITPNASWHFIKSVLLDLDTLKLKYQGIRILKIPPHHTPAIVIAEHLKLVHILFFQAQLKLQLLLKLELRLALLSKSPTTHQPNHQTNRPIK